MAQYRSLNIHQKTNFNDLGNTEETNQRSNLENWETEASQSDEYRTGYKQEHGIYYWETYIPVIIWTTVRLIITLAMKRFELPGNHVQSETLPETIKERNQQRGCGTCIFI